MTALRAEGCSRLSAAGCVSLRSGGDSGSAAEDDGGALRAQILKKPAPVLVISTVAGQPPIGKPLIVQARGQLRLTWRLYAESPQSGEISRLHGQESIEEGDLSTQSIIGAVCIYPLYRHIPPLEMTVAAGTIEHTFGVKVQRVQRVVVSPWGDAYKVSVTGLTGFPQFSLNSMRFNL